MSAAVHQCLGDFRKTEELALETIALAEKSGFPYWIAWETGLMGWARARAGDIEGGIALLENGLRNYRETGSELFCPHLEGLLAEVNLRAHRHDRALHLCEEALASAERTDAHFFDAEILRIEGECRLARDHDSIAAASCFAAAMEVARGQGASMLALRAAVRLASLSRVDGRAEEARRTLSEAIGEFHCDPAVPELRDARDLLREWG
jgi:predicted ATPase